MRHFFIALNLSMSLVALIYDIPSLRLVPAWALPFIIICPLYPALLAWVWWRPNRVVAAFALVPSATYGLLALMFYPTWMFQNGFDWNALSQIGWVMIYALQALYLLKVHRLEQWRWLGAIWMITCLVIQFQTLSFGYLGLGDISPFSRFCLLCLGCLGSLIIATYQPRMLKQNTLLN